MVVSRAVVRDLYPPEETARIFSLLMLVMGIAPIIAPTIGGILVTYAGWQSIFLALAFISFVALVGMRLLLPETKAPDPEVSLHPRQVLQGYGAILQNRQFLTYMLVGGIASGGMFAYISGSPFVFIELHAVPEARYGWIFGANAFGLIMSSQLNRALLRKSSTVQIVRIVNLVQLAFGLLLVGYAISGYGGLPALVVLIFLYMAMLGFIYPNTTALALAPFSKNAGAASALMGALQSVIAALSAAIVSLIHNNTALPMTGAMAAASLLGLIVLRAGARPHTEPGAEKVVEKTSDPVVSVSRNRF